MDEATQQNAALVEEAAAAAESLQEQTQQLTRAVAVFKVAQNEAAFAVAVPKAAPVVVTAMPRRKPTPVQATATEAASKAKKIVNAKRGGGKWEEF
jgi:hypothetical protein